MTTHAGPLATKPPYLLRTPRLVLRCMEPSDAALRKDAADSSGAFLRTGNRQDARIAYWFLGRQRT